MNDNISPEERLFKVIQREKSSPAHREKSAQGKGAWEWLKDPRQAIGLWKEKSISVIQGFIKKTGIVFPKRPQEIELKTVNIAMSVALLFLILFVIYYALARYPNIAKMTGAAARAQSSLPPAHKEITELQPVNYYTEGPRHRDIFGAAQRPLTQGPETTAVKDAKGSSGELVLQGIAWSDGPKALIQAGKENKLYVLKEGQTIGTTGVKVKKILRNKVILTSGDRDIEL